MTPIELAREVFPDWDDASLDHALWGRTGFPGFFHLKEGQTVEDRLREQLIEYRDTIARMKPGDQLCDHCGNLALPGKWTCFDCGFFLDWHSNDPKKPFHWRKRERWMMRWRRVQIVFYWSWAVARKWARLDFRVKP